MMSLGTIIEYEGSIVFFVSGKVRTSMLGKLYDGTTAFTLHALLACDCSCKSGSENDERIACVHTMAKLY